MLHRCNTTTHKMVEELCPVRKVVAAVLSNQEQLALFQRSHKVHGDKGLWHCITGFLPSGTDPVLQAKTEIFEEASIKPHALTLVNSCILDLEDNQGNVWQVHAFHYETQTRQIVTNWENDQVKWVCHDGIMGSAIVSWLPNILASLDISKYASIKPSN